MCQPVKNYLGLVREYKSEIVTFAGLVLMVYVYQDYKELTHEMAKQYAENTAAMRGIVDHLDELKTYHQIELGRKDEKP